MKYGIMKMWIGLLTCNLFRYVDGDGGGGDPGEGGDPGDGGDGGDGGEPGGGEPAVLSSLFGEGSDYSADEFITGLAGKPITEAVPALAKEVVELRSMKGKKGLVALGADATDEEKTAFNGELNALRGVPATSDDYEYDIPDDIMKNMDPELFKGRLAEFHDANYTNEQVQAGLNMFFEEAGHVTGKADEIIDGWKAEGDEWAKTEWGAAEEANRATAESAMTKFGVLEDLQMSGFAGKKNVLNAFHQLGAAMQEGKVPEHAGGTTGSPSVQLAALKADPAYTNARLRVGDKANIMGDIMTLQKQIRG